MKHKLCALLICMGLLFSLALSASAASELPLVIDDAWLMTSEEQSALGEKAQALGQEYGIDIVILTVDGLDGKTPQDYADDYFDYNGYGRGDNHSGVLFLLSMEERDWYISTSGDAIYALTDYGIQATAAEALPYLSGGEYYSGFYAWLDILPVYFDAYLHGEPIDGYADYSGDYYHGDRESVVYYEQERSPSVFVSLVIGLIVAAIVIAIMRASMNTKRPQQSAYNYLKSNSFRLRTQQDLFLYSNVTKTHRPKETSGGGSSVHRSSSGRSHGGGGGKF